MQITIRSEKFMKKSCLTTNIGATITYNENISRRRQIWTAMRNYIASGEVMLASGDKMVGDYWAFISMINKRPVIRRISSKEPISRRIQILNRIKTKYENGTYSGDFVVMKSSQQSYKHSWPLVFRSGGLHILTNNIEWILGAAVKEEVSYQTGDLTFINWRRRNLNFPPYMSNTEKEKMNHRMLEIFLLKQLNSKRLWKAYINRYNARFGYLTYSKGKAKMWHHAAGDHCRVLHDLDDIISGRTLVSLQNRGWLPNDYADGTWQEEDE